MHPLYGTLPEPYEPVHVTHGTVIAHRWTYSSPRCRTSQYRRTFILLSVSLWNDLWWPRIRWCGTGRASIVGPMPFYWHSGSFPFCFILFSLSLLSFNRLALWGWGFGLIGCLSFSPSLVLPTFFTNNKEIFFMRLERKKKNLYSKRYILYWLNPKMNTKVKQH